VHVIGAAVTVAAPVVTTEWPFCSCCLYCGSVAAIADVCCCVQGLAAFRCSSALGSQLQSRSIADFDRDKQVYHKHELSPLPFQPPAFWSYATSMLSGTFKVRQGSAAAQEVGLHCTMLLNMRPGHGKGKSPRHYVEGRSPLGKGCGIEWSTLVD
jgi:hypothetical protein